MKYTLALSELLEMDSSDAIRGDYCMPDDPEERDFRVSAVLADKRKDPWYPELLEDIRVHGFRTPIWIDKEEVNDGGHRIAAAQDLGIEHLLCTDEEPDDPEASTRIYDVATETWSFRGWTRGRRP